MKTLALILSATLSLSAFADPVCRTKQGRICRSSAVRHAFMKLHPCPSTGSTKRCSTHVIDHIKALSCARSEEERRALDSVGNMQWMTKVDAKAKDREERKMCGAAD